MDELSPDFLLRAYCAGAFPMAPTRDAAAIQWFSPDPRALIPLKLEPPGKGRTPGCFHVPKSLARRVRSGRYRVTFDAAFEQVMRGCAQPRPGADETWINQRIIDAYCRLHAIGFAHSVEAWLDDEAAGPPRLVGGLYGVSIGAAFCGESMFSTMTDASRVCLVHLVEHLRGRGYQILDAQLHNEHLEQFGLELIPREAYLRRIQNAVMLPITWADE